MKPVLAWAVVNPSGTLAIYMDRYFRIATTRKRAQRDLIYVPVSRVVRVEIREFTPIKAKARKS